MSDIKFIDGLRAFKPHQNAPDFVKAQIQIDVAELTQWLSTQTEEKVRADLKESKSGTYYLAVNNFKPDSRNTGGSGQDGGPPPAADFDSDLPF